MIKDKRNILVFGGSGNLGSTIKQNSFFSNALFPSKKKLNLLNKKKIFNFIKKNKINIIVHAAGIARMKKCELKKKYSLNVNVIGIKNVVDSIKRINSKIYFIYISSDGVYESTNGNYVETDKLNPYNFYGITKVKAEQYVGKLKNFLIIRTRFFNKNKIKFKDAAFDSFSSAIEVNDLVQNISFLISKRIKGILNVGRKNKISNYHLFKRYKKNIKKCTFASIQNKLNFIISKDASMKCDKFYKILKKNVNARF